MATTEDGTETRTQLRTGRQYVESLRDDRVVFYKGERVEDVTDPQATAGGIRQIADIYDLQSTPRRRRPDVRARRRHARHLVLSHPEDQGRPALPPRGHQVRRAPVLRHGRPRHRHDRHAAARDARRAATFQRECPEYAENIHWLLRHDEENNIRLGETIVDPQGYRSRARARSPTARPPERATARIVDENKDGIFISGMKGVGTAVPQSNEMSSGASTCRWPRRASGSTSPSTRRGCGCTARGGAPPRRPTYDHPLDARGEEIESIVAFDGSSCRGTESWRASASPARRQLLQRWARFEHWYTFAASSRRRSSSQASLSSSSTRSSSATSP